MRTQQTIEFAGVAPLYATLRAFAVGQGPKENSGKRGKMELRNANYDAKDAIHDDANDQDHRSQ